MTDYSRSCLNCQHIFVDYEADYSDITPGSGFELKCLKYHHWNDQWMTVADLREVHRIGQTCRDFEAADD